ncbi:helix-turn-helix domain-containing protein [Flavobacteriaceae bacterium Ap0902]|nr:helix-turn-helix domain-containing protein [Flavobacteriaceae bacterium Ap0902]
MRFEIFLVSIFYLFCTAVSAQNLKFKTYTVEDGLSNNSINSIGVDTQGGLVIATWDGLNYYDGHEFFNYKHIQDDSTSIANNFVYKIVKDIDQRLWIYSKGNQISRFNPDRSFTNYSFERKINDIGLSKNKSVLVEIENKYYTFSKDQFVPCINCNLFENKQPWKAIFQSYYPTVQWVSYLKDSYGNLWIGTRREGLFYIPSDHILDLQKEDIQHYTHDPYDKFSLESNEITAIKEDAFQNIWIGTKDGGLSRVYKNSESVFYTTHHPENNPNLPNETIRAITVDTEDQIWLGYYNEGLFYKRKGARIYSKFIIPRGNENPAWNKIRSLSTTSDGSILIGTYAGFIRYKDGKITYFEAENHALFPNNRNYGFYETDNQQLYVACWGGVALLDLKTNRFLTFPGQSTLNNYHVRDLIEVNNTLYIATENSGVIALKNNKTQSILKDNNSPDKNVYSLWYDDANDRLWMGTLGGLVIYDKNENKIVKKITESNGLKSHLIYGIIGHDHQVWVSTTDGLAMIDTNTYATYIYSGQEGLQAAEFSEGAYTIDHKGIMYFGGVNGLNYFNPDNINLEEDLPIIKLYVDQKQPITDYEKPYDQNNVIYTIDPTFYGDSNGNQIYYKLEGYDDIWHVTGYERLDITYQDLPAGNYIFKIKNGRNQEYVVEHNLLIQKPFWQSLYFYLLLFLLLVTSLVIILIQKRKKQLQRERILENKIKERVEEISIQKKEISVKNQELIEKNAKITAQKEALHQLHAQLKTESMEMDKFNAYLVNEYKKPLNKILHFIKNIDVNNADKIQREINQLLNKIIAVDYLSKIDKNHKLQPYAVEIENATEAIFNEIIAKLEVSNIKFNLVKNTQPLWVSIDLLYYKLFLKYLFTDITKYPFNNNILDIQYTIGEHELSIKLNWTNQLLSKNLYYIEHYSPYYQACKKIAALLNIKATIHQNHDNCSFTMTYKPILLSEESMEHAKLNWMHLELETQIDKNKPTLLIWANKTDNIIVNQLFKGVDANVIIEPDKGLVLSAIKSLPIELVFIYNKNLGENVYKLVTKLNKKHPEIKIVYISEDISFDKEDQTIELGIDDMIQLPATHSYVQKKVDKLLNHQKIDFKKQKLYMALDHDFLESTQTQNEAIIKEAVSIIQNKMSDSQFNVKELCEELGISTIKCYRIFKEVLDIPPSEFILNLKMSRAKNLLLTTSLNIAEVAYELGFADPKYFTKVFKKTYGKSPKKFQSDEGIG